jgi:sirohydrochlorin ferrochelatase
MGVDVIPPGLRHLLIVAHGSRRAESNDEVRHLAARVSDLRSPGIDHVETAFLELAQPSIPEGLGRCVALGAREIVVFPYFLAAGTHVAQDIPEAVAAFMEQYPDIKIRLARHVGAAHGMAHTVLDAAGAE